MKVSFFKLCILKSKFLGNSYVVFVPARTFEISKRSIRNYWVHNTESKVEADDGELDFKVCFFEFGISEFSDFRTRWEQTPISIWKL